MGFRKKISVLAVAASIGLSASMLSGVAFADSIDEQKLKREISFAEYYVKEFEKEVALQKGGEKQVWRSKKDALDRVQKLKTEYPYDPTVEELFQRTKTALMKSKGDYTEVPAEWLRYKSDAANLIKLIAAESEKAWKQELSKYPDMITKAFPAPDYHSVSLIDLQDKYVLLEDVMYPSNQFYGSSEYIWHGKPSTGYYYVALEGRQWLAPYEAIKRFKRNVDSSLEDIGKYTVLGKIVDVTSEIPDAAEEKKGSFQTGWVVEPVALYVQGHVAAFFDKDKEPQGYYANEDQVKSIKESWYTVKSIPNDVTPEGLMEIFMLAIKEKNWDLYLDCINPDRRVTPTGNERIRYHWDLHQGRFQKEYVHAKFDEAKITVVKGFDSGNSQENFFLDDNQKEILKKTQGKVEERAVVNSRAFNENGKQIGSPHPHELIRKGGGRWYVEDYAARF